MDAGDLAIFAAAAQAGGMTKAAETLNTVQSNVTQRIRRLEAELGVPLFNRHSRGVTLTSAGAHTGNPLTATSGSNFSPVECSRP